MIRAALTEPAPAPPDSILDLQPGDRTTIVRVLGEGGYRRRLLELGLLPGTPLRLVRRVDISELVEIEVRGGMLSLRRSEAGSVCVEAPHVK